MKNAQNRRNADKSVSKNNNNNKHANGVSIVTATRTLVDGLLSRNEGNRPLNRKRVEAIVSDINCGRWRFNGDTIVVSAEGNLVDGQHRLTAIKEAGYAPLKLIVVNLAASGDDAEEVFRTIDCGKFRTMGDTLHTEGVKYASNAAAVCRCVVMSSRGYGTIPTKGEMHDVYELMRDEINAFTPFCRKTRGIVQFTAASVAAFSVVSYLTGKREEVKRFAEKVRDGVDLVRNSAHHRLFAYIHGNCGRHVSCEMQYDTFCATCRAMFHVIQNGENCKISSLRGFNDRTMNYMRSLSKDSGSRLFYSVAA